MGLQRLFRRSILTLVCLASTYGSIAILISEVDRKVPLDLPVAEASTGLDFFGACIEGDAFVWCLDRSCSMGWGGEMDVVKQEVIDALGQLSPPQQFSLLAYSSSYAQFSLDLLEADPDYS